MTYSDLLIIYLAIGSPTAVYYVLRSGRDLSLKTISRMIPALLLWPAYTIWLLTHSRTAGHPENRFLSDHASLDAARSKRVDGIRAEMEKKIREQRPEHSLFDFREVFERYVGLTTAVAADISDDPSPFADLTSGTSEEAKLNAISLNRRNRRLLEFHQIQARNDLLSLAEQIADQEFDRLAAKLGALVRDDELVKSLRVERIGSVQSGERTLVISLENEVWTSETGRQSVASRL